MTLRVTEDNPNEDYYEKKNNLTARKKALYRGVASSIIFRVGNMSSLKWKEDGHTRENRGG